MYILFQMWHFKGDIIYMRHLEGLQYFYCISLSLKLTVRSFVNFKESS